MIEEKTLEQLEKLLSGPDETEHLYISALMMNGPGLIEAARAYYNLKKESN